jgi:hypothetical protein
MTNELSLQLDLKIAEHPGVKVISSILAQDDKTTLIDIVAAKFRKWAHIMIKEAAARLADHKPYDNAIDIKDRETAPLGPCNSLREKKLEVLRKWLKELLETGKIRGSK